MAESEFIIGADEVGKGAWAGPALVCALVVPVGWTLEGLNDSKKLSPKKREKLYDEIQGCYPFVRPILYWVWPEEIDREGIGKALWFAFRAAVQDALGLAPGARVILDGDIKIPSIEHESYPKADGTYPAVMGASVYAKVERDRWMMTEGDSEFPQYGWVDSKGYGTAAHQEALDRYGPCRLHRMSFAPVFERSGAVAYGSSLVRPRDRSSDGGT